MTLFHGLKIGFEYLPDLGSKGTFIGEIAFLRFVWIRGVTDVPSDVQDGD
jgi:hypothetical protein